MILNELQQILHLLRREVGLFRDLLDRGVAIELLPEHAPGPGHAPHLVGDMNRKPNRAPLFGQGA